MTDYVISKPDTTSLTVVGEDDRFPVRRIFCVGRNYAAHAREMGMDPERDPPFFFTKPSDAAFDAGVTEKASIPYPLDTRNFHYEAELTVAIGKGGSSIQVKDALEHVYGYATSLDLTRRDLNWQLETKAAHGIGVKRSIYLLLQVQFVGEMMRLILILKKV